LQNCTGRSDFVVQFVNILYVNNYFSVQIVNTPPRVSGRQRLIDATLTSLGEHGYHRSSLRTIADIAGVTAGLVKHHFQGKDALMLEAYRHFRNSLLENCLDAADKAGADPVKRLEALTRSILLLNPSHAGTMRIWAGFVDLVITDPAAAAVQATNRQRHVREIRGCITGIYAARGERLSPKAAQRLALGVNSAIDGVWLECGLNPSVATPEEALAIALDMIGGRLGVSFSNGAQNGA